MDGDRPGRVLAGLGSFLAAGPASPADPRQQAVELFHRVAGSVPAYRAFLREHGVDPAAVRTLADFERLPLMTKENYHRRYPLPERCRDGRLDDCDMIAVSSGSTGQPTFWPRSVADELAVAARFEQVFAGQLRAPTERTTLAVVCFPLGTWVGGLYTAGLLPAPGRQGLPDHGGRARATTRPRSCAWSPNWRRALRPDRAAGLPAVPQGRDRHRDRRGPGLAAVTRSSWCWPARCSARSGATWWASGPG